MEALWNAEIDLVVFLQSLGIRLTMPMRLVSLLGNEGFFLLLLPALYWCIDAALGVRYRLGVLFPPDDTLLA